MADATGGLRGGGGHIAAVRRHRGGHPLLSGAMWPPTIATLPHAPATFSCATGHSSVWHCDILWHEAARGSSAPRECVAQAHLLE